MLFVYSRNTSSRSTLPPAVDVGMVTSSSIGWAGNPATAIAYSVVTEGRTVSAGPRPVWSTGLRVGTRTPSRRGRPRRRRPPSRARGGAVDGGRLDRQDDPGDGAPRGGRPDPLSRPLRWRAPATAYTPQTCGRAHWR